jgi:hypothetical protein
MNKWRLSSNNITKIIIAFISVFGTITGAYFVFRGNTAPIELSLNATQTAESKKLTFTPAILITNTTESTPTAQNSPTPINATEINLPTNVKLSLEVYKYYDFEMAKDLTDTKPWFSIPIVKNHTSLISKEGAFAHSGSNSYQLIVKTNPYSWDTKTEYSGIGILDKKLLELTDIKLISAWVFIPFSEPIRDHNFQTHILAYKYDKNGEPISFSGKDTKIELGKWTRLLLGTFQNSNAIPDFIWNGDINELYISIWCDKEYNGSIFIDDVVIYK